VHEPAGTAVDTGPAGTEVDMGPADTGPADTGPADTGPAGTEVDMGPADTGPVGAAGGPQAAAIRLAAGRARGRLAGYRHAMAPSALGSEHGAHWSSSA